MQQQTPYQPLQDTRARSEGFDHRLVQPIARRLRSLFRPALPKDSRVPPPRATWQTSLARNSTVVFHDVQDVEVELVLGSLWITQDGDIEDYVLAPGQRWRVRRQGATVLNALTDSSIEVTYPEPRAAACMTPAAGPLAALASGLRSRTAG